MTFHIKGPSRFCEVYLTTGDRPTCEEFNMGSSFRQEANNVVARQEMLIKFLHYFNVQRWEFEYIVPKFWVTCPVRFLHTFRDRSSK